MRALKESVVNSTTRIHQKKPRLGDRTDRAWFSHLVRHPARKWSGSILTTPEPTRGAVTKNQYGSILVAVIAGSQGTFMHITKRPKGHVILTAILCP